MTAPGRWRLPPPIDDPALDELPEPGEVWPVNPAIRDWVEPDDIGWPRMGLTRLEVAGLWAAAAVGVLLGLLIDRLRGDRP